MAFNIWVTVIAIVVVMGAILGACTYLILAERKISAWVQDRIGPNRVGPMGLLQPIADMIKFIFKEEIIPDYVDKLLYLLAPTIAVITAMFAFAVVPFGPTGVRYPFVIAPHVDIGIVFIFAVTSLNVYAIILGGWASNNKYSLLGSLRSSAQIVSYEIPMGLSIFGVVLMTGSLNLESIMNRQIDNGILGWNIWVQPLAFLLFLVSVFAESNRLPFDLPEAEQELVGGYHTEYSALKFGLFFLGEYTHVITTSFLLAVVFCGGWHFPGVQYVGGIGGVVLKVIVLLLKVTSFIVFYMLIRWTLPRFRFDQLMALAWKVMIPLAVINLVCVMIVKQVNAPIWLLLPLSLAILLGAALLASQWPAAQDRLVRVTRGHEEMEIAAR
jgi:NADH-quinone oxidoreductase subunit H